MTQTTTCWRNLSQMDTQFMTKRVVATMVMITNNPEITVITSSIHIDIVFHSRLKAAADASLRSA